MMMPGPVRPAPRPFLNLKQKAITRGVLFVVTVFLFRKHGDVFDAALPENTKYA